MVSRRIDQVTKEMGSETASDRGPGKKRKEERLLGGESDLKFGVSSQRLMKSNHQGHRPHLLIWSSCYLASSWLQIMIVKSKNWKKLWLS